MAVAALFMQGAGSVLNALGSYEQGQAQAQAAQYGAAVARNNALVAENNARLEEAKGNEEIFRSREATAQMIGAERAGFGASGVDVTRGSAERVQESTARVGAANELTLRQNTARNAYAFRTQAVNFENDATMKDFEAKNDIAAGKLGAISSLISGGSRTGSKYAEWKMIS